MRSSILTSVCLICLITTVCAGCIIGPIGPQGDQGVPGPPGGSGLRGPAGQNGTAGLQGITGQGGPAGPQGLIGLEGTAGPQGPIGPGLVTFNWTEFFDPPPPLAPGEHINCWTPTGEQGAYLLCTNNGINDKTWRFDGKSWLTVYTGPGDILYRTGSSILLVKSGSKGGATFPVSTDGGLHWLEFYSTPINAAGGLSNCGIFATPGVIYWADVNVVYKTVDKGQTWNGQPCPIGTITSLKGTAAGGDIVAAGVDNSGKVRVARQKAGQSTWQVLDTSIPLASPATYAEAVLVLGYPARDGVITTTQTRDGNSGAWSCNWTDSKWVRIDNGNRVNQGVGIWNSLQNAGTVEEGFGLTYICDQNSIVRIRGNTNVSERIAIPSNMGVTSVLWFAPIVDPPIGVNIPVELNIGVDTNGDGKIEKIIRYSDAMNRPVTGVTASFIAPSSAVVNWNAVPGAINYGIFISNIKQTSYYTATNDPGILLKYNPGDTMAWISGLSSNSSYYITVWAIYPVSSFYGSTRLTNN